MTFFDFIGLFDHILLQSVSPFWVVVFWATMAGAVSMALYTFLTPQNKLLEIKKEIGKAQGELIRHEGDFAGLQKANAKVLKLSFKRLGLVLLPTLVALPPALFLIVWVDFAFSYKAPDQGEKVMAYVTPPGAVAKWPGRAKNLGNGKLEIVWPDPNKGIIFMGKKEKYFYLYDAQNPGGHLWAGGTIWRWIDPSAGLPLDLGIDEISFDLPRLEIIGFGPVWARGWEATFLLTILAVSLFIKFAFKIH